MSSQAQSLDATALEFILFLAIYVCIRVTLVWIVSFSSRYGIRSAHGAKALCRRRGQVCRNCRPDISDHSISGP